jgi:oligopeptide/dipeptide ABC transporter ATP-binding protein
VSSGRVWLEGRELLTMSRRQLRALRGRQIAMIFQDPATSLNPVLTIGRQVAEAVRAHRPGWSWSEARSEAVRLLERVGVPHPGRRLGDLPHTWSGGMRQRAMIAMAIANRPRLLIADEPTTALDVTIQAQVLELLRLIQSETSAGLILITHDFGVVAEMANRVAVMYAGKVMESGAVDEVFAHPHHPYTAALLQSLPRLDQDRPRLTVIPGQPPSLSHLPRGCPFRPRCYLGEGEERCGQEEPALLPTVGSPHHQAACHFQGELAGS